MAAGAVRVGNTVAAAITNRRVLESVEANIAIVAGLSLSGLAALAFWFPRGIAYPLGAFAFWLAIALLYRGLALNRRGTKAGLAEAERRRDVSETDP
jgi:cardiolipin synthase